MRLLAKHAIIVILMVMVTAPGSSAPAAEKRWETVSPRDLRQMMAAVRKPVLINTMSPLECADHSIPGSMCIPAEEFESHLLRLPAEKDRTLVFYCESEITYKSCEAADLAVGKGYTRVMVLDGGLPSWKRAGYETEAAERIPREAVEAIKPPVLRQWLKEKKDILLVDIRPEKLFQQGHIEGAVNIPMYRLHLRYRELPLNRLLILVDNRGFRTPLAASYLIRKGYEVKRLFGGMAKWEEIVSKDKTLKK
jgi:rhodanese-related sulfurtransferase